MVVSRSTKENIPFVIEAERELPAEQQTTFLLATLTNDMMLSLLQLMQNGDTKKWVEVALFAGLRGWQNFKDEEGNETPFKRDGGSVTLHGVQIAKPVSRASIEVIPVQLLLELAQAIVRSNRLTTDDAKN